MGMKNEEGDEEMRQRLICPRKNPLTVSPLEYS